MNECRKNNLETKNNRETIAGVNRAWVPQSNKRRL